jgi:carboxylesterase
MAQILPTAEPFFFPGRGEKGRVGCLVIHGFTGTPKEMRWLGEYLNRQGYTVCGIRLAGHATRLEDMIRSRYTDWLLSVEDGYHLLRACTNQVFLLGLSMGGVLALTSATHLPVSGVVAMSTPYCMPQDFPLPLPLMRFLSYFRPYLPKNGDPESGWYDEEARRQHVAYSANPLRSAVELKVLLAEMRAALPQVRVPVLLIHSRNDPTVPPEHMTQLYEHLGTARKEMLWVEGAGHVITEEPPRPMIFEAVAQFIERTAGSA